MGGNYLLLFLSSSHMQEHGLLLLPKGGAAEGCRDCRCELDKHQGEMNKVKPCKTYKKWSRLLGVFYISYSIFYSLG